MKNRYKFILVLSVTCTILSLCLASFSFSVAVNSNNKEEVHALDSGDFDKLFYEENFHYFEVSDFAEKDINKINIAAKKYKTNTITVTDSDFKISEKLSNDIYKTIKDYGKKNSFYMVSLDDGMTVGYNVDSVYETASSIKAPYALYVYKEIAKGNIDRNHLITYKEKHKIGKIWQKRLMICYFLCIMYLCSKWNSCMSIFRKQKPRSDKILMHELI